MEPRSYDENSITIDFSVIFFQKTYLDLTVIKQKFNIRTLRKKAGKTWKTKLQCSFLATYRKK